MSIRFAVSFSNPVLQVTKFYYLALVLKQELCLYISY